jgi:hypothetical protein
MTSRKAPERPPSGYRRNAPSRPGIPPAGRPRPKRGPWLVAIVALVATTILVVALGNDRPADETPATAPKPNVHVGFFIERGGAIWPGRPGEIVRPGDTIQFTTTTDLPSFVAVLSVSGDGQVDVLYPEGQKAAAVPAGREVGLPASTILDATLGQERIVGLFCNQAVELEPVRLALQAQPATLPPPSGCQAEVFTWNKRAP